MGVNVQRYKAAIFLVSSMYAGLSGVMYGLSIGRIAPESFGRFVSIQYLAMIGPGGLGSLGGCRHRGAVRSRCTGPTTRSATSTASR
ncbi:hypothetical protein [Cryptosporangium sp. NPDC051539]|uniref:ABC transporter permease subunit n=1 Tax=Cryptosporangium sp. NPDC051539 TaxID=3363962 RepID=UPI003787F9AA